MRLPAGLRERHLLAGALLVAIVATIGSINFTGIPSLGWRGMGLLACDLCWYQRILMYPLVPVLAVALLARRSREAPVFAARIGLVLAVPGAVIAAYHSLIQHLPQFEVSVCSVGSCTLIDYLLFGILTIPNLSLIAFLLLIAPFALVLVLRRTVAQPESGG